MPGTQGNQAGPGLGPRSGSQGTTSKGNVSTLRATNAQKETKDFWAEDWAKKLPRSAQKASGVKGKMGKQGDVIPMSENKSLPQSAPAATPYFKVYESYRREAEDAVAKEQIPHGYKKQVKDYFESLNPTK